MGDLHWVRSATAKWVLGRMTGQESDADWRRRLAAEMEDACQAMARRGHRLLQVVPVLNTANDKGSWTEGAWLVFGPGEPHLANT